MSMNLTTWTAISLLRQTREPLLFWQHILGAGFERLQPFLAPCPGLAGKRIYCPDTGLPMEVWASSGGYRAVAVGEHAEDAEDRALTWKEAQAWKIDAARLRTALCQTLNLTGITAGAEEHAEIQLIGGCGRHGHPRRVYLCHARNAESAATLAAAALGKSDTGCILFPERYPLAEQLLKGGNVAFVPLADTLVWQNGAWTGNCGHLCQACRKPESTEALLGDIHTKIAVVAQQKRELTQARDERQATIEQLVDGADRFLAGLQAKLTETERNLFFALITRVEDGGLKRPLSYAEIGERMGKITKQAVEKKIRQLFEREPKLKLYVASVRKPLKASKFSELSPSDRRKYGIEASSGYSPG